MALIAILGAIAFSAVPVSAQDPVYSNLVTSIAQRFNLKEADVAAVVKDVRTQHMTTMRSKWEAKLSQAVTDGKITEAQRQAIIAKHDEVQGKINAAKDLPDAERKVKAKEAFADLEKWSVDNNINLKQFGLFGFGHSMGRGYRAKLAN
jgi:hypothetical protein